MKPTLEDAIEQLKVTSDPPERLQRRLEDLLNTPVPKQRLSRGRDWFAVGAVGVAIAALSVVAVRLNVAPPPAPSASMAINNTQFILEKAYQKYSGIWKRNRFMVIGTEISQRLTTPDNKGRRWRKMEGVAEVHARKEILRTYREVLALAHQAMEEPSIPISKDKYIVNDYSENNYFDHYYAITSLLCIEVLAKVDQGDTERALSDALDIVALGTKLERGAQWRGWQAAGAVKYQGWQMLERLLPYLNRNQAQSAAQQLELLETNRAPLASMFQATRWAAYKTFQAKSWDQCMFDFVISYGPRSTLALKATPKAWIIAEHLRYLEALEVYAKNAEWWERPVPNAPKDAFNQYMEYHLTQVFRDERLSRTSAALIIARLRRHADSRARLPEDPFSPGKTLRERPDGLIYSVGPDGVDNDGALLERTNGPGDISQLL